MWAYRLKMPKADSGSYQETSGHQTNCKPAIVSLSRVEIRQTGEGGRLVPRLGALAAVKGSNIEFELRPMVVRTQGHLHKELQTAEAVRPLEKKDWHQHCLEAGVAMHAVLQRSIPFGASSTATLLQHITQDSKELDELHKSGQRKYQWEHAQQWPNPRCSADRHAVSCNSEPSLALFLFSKGPSLACTTGRCGSLRGRVCCNIRKLEVALHSATVALCCRCCISVCCSYTSHVICSVLPGLSEKCHALGRFMAIPVYHTWKWPLFRVLYAFVVHCHRPSSSPKRSKTDYDRSFHEALDP